MLLLSVSLLMACGGSKQTETAGSAAAVPAETEAATVTSSHEETGTSVQESTKTVPETTKAVPATTQQETTAKSEKADTETKIWVASDIHYLSGSLRDEGPAFEDMLTHGDGRLVQYCSEITDAFKEEVIAAKPALLILCGDLTFEGEEKSHKGLVRTLTEIKDAGIPVIVIPGNHDINNEDACSYDGAEVAPVAHISPDDFKKIYADFGYKDAVSYDSASLSYVYQMDPSTRIMMLDSCQYSPKAVVGGMIREATYDWMKEQFEDAAAKNMKVITVSHHNVLDESEVYTDDCTIEHSERLVEMLNDENVLFHLSGHLHVQHYMKSEDSENAFYEIVTGSLTTPPCCYGVMKRSTDGSWTYEAGNVDMEAWAKKKGYAEKNLMNFSSYKDEFLEEVFANQAYEEFDRQGILDQISSEDKKEMSGMYARLNTAYYAGKACEIADEIRASDGYRKWIDLGYKSKFIDYIDSILSDATEDYTRLNIPSRK